MPFVWAGWAPLSQEGLKVTHDDEGNFPDVIPRYKTIEFQKLKKNLTPIQSMISTVHLLNDI